MKIKKKILAKGLWGKNFTSGRVQKVKYIVVHYTASGAPALNNLKYFASKHIGASAHLFVDPNGDVYKSVYLKDTAWAVGAKSYKHPECRNVNSISIEVVNAGKDAFTPAQVEKLKSLVTELMEKYNVPASHILRHHDVTGKSCPLYYCGSATKDKRWTKLHKEITGGNDKKSTAPATPAKPATPATPAKPAKPATPAKPAFKKYKVKVTATSLIVRKSATVAATKVKSLKRGDVVTVTDKTTGYSVGGNKNWLKISSGYIAEYYTKKV
jgi:N-acetylmuramoyl-L-alanine amidase CwlA